MVDSGDLLVTSLYDFQYERMIIKLVVSKLEKSKESWEANFWSILGLSDHCFPVFWWSCRIFGGLGPPDLRLFQTLYMMYSIWSTARIII